MSVSDTDVSDIYNGNGVLTDFTIPFDFELGENTQVKVYTVTQSGSEITANPQTEGALQDYTLTGDDIPNGQNYTTVSFNTAPASGTKVLIIRVTPRTQSDDYDNAASVPNTTLEARSDYLTRLIQEIGEETDRAIKFKLGSEQTDVSIEEPNAGKFLAWNADGTAIVSTDGELGTVTVPAGTGLLAKDSSTTTVARTIIGTENEIEVIDGDGVSGNPTLGLPDDPVLPGTGAVTLPQGTDAQQPSGTDASLGMIRYNTDQDYFEGNGSSGWAQLAGGSSSTSNVEGYIQNIGLAAGTTGVANDSITITGANGSPLSSGNPGTIVLPGATPGQLTTFTVTADVTIDLTGAHWGLGTNGDRTDYPLAVYAVNDAGTLKWAVHSVDGLKVLKGANDETTQTNVTTLNKFIASSALTGDSSAHQVGWFKANFDDTGGSSEDLWSVQTSLGDIGLGTKVFDRPFVPTWTSLGSVSNNLAFHRYEDGKLNIRGFVTAGTRTAVLTSFSLPSAFQMDTNNISRSNTTSDDGEQIGFWTTDNTAAHGNGVLVTATGTSTTLVYFGKVSTSTTSTQLTPQLSTNAIASNAEVSYTCKIPVNLA